MLEKDPCVNADQVRTITQKIVVTLEGLALNKRQKQMAVFDTRCVFGVDKVVNKLEVKT
ncbi:BON domain-containing protein [Candidatus Nitrospira salsa]